jgi:hypothetical protein
MAKRFKTLKKALKTLLPVNADPDTVPPNPPAGTVLEYFLKRDSRNIEYPTDADRSRKLNTTAVHPFGAAYVATTPIRVPISDKAFTAIGTFIGGTGAELNLVGTVPDTALTNKLFKPAKATVFIPSATQPTTKIASKITGFKYKPRAGNSKTYPFGRADTGTKITFAACKADITAKVIATNANASVSFTPEDGRYL